MKKINLFITGLGNVGSELLSLIDNNEHSKKANIKIIGISNSKNMFFDNDGIDLSNWKNLLANGKKNNRQEFLNKTINSKIFSSMWIFLCQWKKIKYKKRFVKNKKNFY